MARKRKKKSWPSLSELRRIARAAAYGVEENFTSYMRRRVRIQFNGQCFKCGVARKKMHIDHHKPLSAGYPLEYGNAVLLCPKCNRAKGSKMPEDFYTKIELAQIKEILSTQRRWRKKEA